MDVLDVVARSLGRQLGGRWELDELKGHAHEALLDVLSTFDEARGVSFRGYARLRLRGAIIDGLRRETGLPRGVAARLRALEAADLYVEEKSEELGAHGRAQIDAAAAADARLGNVLRGLATAYATGLVAHASNEEGDDGAAPPAPEREDPEQQTGRAESRRLLERAIDSLGEPEGTILKRHYFMDEDLQDAAAHLGLSKSWGSRLHARAIERLAVRLRELKGAL
jgi:RNA polymerase sigma factor for flagellar operon FliA